MTTFGSRILASFAAIALIAGTASAQGGRGMGMMGGGGGGMMLANKSVQKELKVSDEQAEKLDAFAQATGAKQREEMQKLADLSDEERRGKMQATARMMTEHVKKGAMEILKPEQYARFEQIQVQQAGLNAFGMARVQEALKLTADQKAKVAEMTQETNAAMREAAQGMQDDREGAMKKIGEIRKEATTKTLALMTPEQMTSWKTLTGEPFEVKMEMPRRRD